MAILQTYEEPYATIEKRLSALNLDFDALTKKAGWNDETIRRFKQRRQVPFRDLERLAQLLALDETSLGTPGAKADDSLGVRLRELRGGDATHFTQSVVLGLCEAAWVIRKQIELCADIGPSQSEHLGRLGFSHDPIYSTAMRPAWKVGYDLAHKARELLGLSEGAPIESLKELIEGQLKIPVVQLELPSNFAGATVANGDSRGIVVNLTGLNRNVWVRRMTLAHELGHLLWDPEEKLRRLIVDEYSDVNVAATGARDQVEMRANGFAIEFLAPQQAIVELFEGASDEVQGIATVMSRYGISRTATVYHLQNAYRGSTDLSQPSSRVSIEPEDDWAAREQMAVDYFNPASVPISRRGYFAAYVERAVEHGLISEDSAAALLACAPEDIGRARESIRNLILTEYA